jgi:hypothetical protein
MARFMLLKNFRIDRKISLNKVRFLMTITQWRTGEEKRKYHAREKMDE